MKRLNDYWFDIERLENFHKPFSTPFNAWITEPSQKYWVEYALKKGIIKEEDAPEYNKNAFNITKHINPLTAFSKKKRA